MRRILLISSLLTPLVALSCERGEGTVAPEASVDPVTQIAKDMIDEWALGDREAMDKTISTELAAEIKEREFTEVRRVINWLGLIEEMEIEEEEAVVGGIRRSYRIKFERDTIPTEVTVANGVVVGFTFDEAAWKLADELSLEASAGTMKIVSFTFIDINANPIEQPTFPGQVDYAIEVEGLQSQLREHTVSVSKAVFDSEGEQIYRQRQPDEIRFPVNESGSSGGRITGTFKVTGPGDYELDLRVTDTVSGTTLVHTVNFAVIPAPQE